MHELYEDLGWYIIQQNSPNSRLRRFGEIKDVLENNKGSGEIEAIVMEDWPEDRDIIEVHPEAFSKMSRIRLLLLKCPTNVPKGLKKLSGSLKFVRWPSFPLEALPLPLDELVHIEMPKSNIKQLWNGIKSMNYLKFINLSESPNFTETPDFSNVQSLEHLCFSSCSSLVKVHESLAVLKELVEVDFHDCKNLTILPSKLKTDSLRKLNLHGCEMVKTLPEFGDGMKELSHLDVSHTAITRLPESVGSLIGLVFLSLEGCKSLVSLPRLPPRLIRLEADGCYSMTCSLDKQLSNLLASLDHECRGQTKYVIFDEEPIPHEQYYYWLLEELEDVKPEYLPFRNFFAIMPSGDKIPSWFPNIKCYDAARYECEIEVDVPPNFRASKWSGIVVCLHIKGHVGVISWSSKAPKDDEYDRWAGPAYGTRSLYGGDSLCVMVLEFNQITCWQHLRGDNNSLHINLSSDYNPRLRMARSIGILGYGWRVICKEDIQNWCHPNHFNQFTQSQHTPPEVKLPFLLLGCVLDGGGTLV